MTSRNRRNQIVKILAKAKAPVTGSTLANQLGVSRQVIVSDITVLRAKGEKIMSTPRGYTVLTQTHPPGILKLIPVKHGPERTEEELSLIVSLGIEVMDVTVDHPLYGQLTGQLSISSQEDVKEFMSTLEMTHAGLLSSLTDGIHLHQIKAQNKAQLECLDRLLKKKGFLLTESD